MVSRDPEKAESPEKAEMIRKTLLSAVCLSLLALAACAVLPASAHDLTNVNSTPDSDAIKIIAMGDQARRIAQESQGGILRQVDTDLTTTDFRFVDRALTRETMIFVPGTNAAPEKWRTTVNTVTPLLTYAQPDMDLHGLRIGPKRVAQAITNHWPGCSVRGLTLYLEQDKLTWIAFCNTLEGVVSGSMDNETGVFQSSSAPPASIPALATPIP